MGACYHVEMSLDIRDKDGAVKALQKKIETDTNVDYDLDRFAKQGIGTESFHDLIRIFLADGEGQKVQIEPSIAKEGTESYTNSFDASYGWETVMIAMFEAIAPFLKDGSELKIWPDSCMDHLVIKNEKCVQLS